MTPAYSLSRSYQVVENVRVTVHLIVPLDVCNTILFVIYLTPSTVSRYFQTALSRPHFSAIANGSYSVSVGQNDDKKDLHEHVFSVITSPKHSFTGGIHQLLQAFQAGAEGDSGRCATGLVLHTL